MDKHGREAEEEREVEGGGDLPGPVSRHRLDPPVQDNASQEGGEVDGGEVVVNVEDAEHEEKGEVVDGPESEHHRGRLEVTNIMRGTGEHVHHGGVPSLDDLQAKDDREDD